MILIPDLWADVGCEDGYLVVRLDGVCYCICRKTTNHILRLQSWYPVPGQGRSPRFQKIGSFATQPLRTGERGPPTAAERRHSIPMDTIPGGRRRPGKTPTPPSGPPLIFRAS